MVESNGRYVVLVPFNELGEAKRVLEHVQRFSQLGHSTVILLMVIQFSPVGGPEEWCIVPPIYRVLELDERKKQAQHCLAGLQRELSLTGINATTLVTCGDTSREIIRIGKQYQVDLIAMTSKVGLAPAQRFWRCVAAEVIRGTKRQVLVIPSSD
jgi:nucleotide-binding universal stress UspA family protein